MENLGIDKNGEKSPRRRSFIVNLSEQLDMKLINKMRARSMQKSKNFLVQRQDRFLLKSPRKF